MMTPTLGADPENSQEMAALFRYASRLMARNYHGQKRGGRHARHAQGKVLGILKESGPMNQRALLEILDVRSSSLSELLSKLTARGLVKRERSEADKRSVIVSATEAADELLDERWTADSETAEQLFACLDAEERKALCDILTKLVASLKDTPEACGEERRFGMGRGGRGKQGRGPGRGRGRG